MAFFGWGDTIVRERARVTTDNNPWMYLGCKTRTGAFAPDDVTLVNCRFVQDDGDPDIYVKAGEAQGLIILCR